MISTRSQSPRGFSLIEVAIALAIFVIGALAIIRIFPGALNVINNNGDQLTATNISRSNFAALQSTNSIPDATFNLKRDPLTQQLTWTTATKADHSEDWGDIAVSVAGIPRLNKTLPDNETVASQDTQSALSNFRAIQGESAKVFVVSATGQTPTPCVFTRFPIAKAGADPTTALAYLPAFSRDLAVLNVRVANDGTLDFSEAKNDGPTPTPFSTASITAGSMLYVSYRYTNAAGETWGIEGEAISAPNGFVANTPFKVVPPTTGASAAAQNSVAPGIVDVTLRQFLGAGSFLPPTNIEKVADARRGLVALPAILPVTINPGDTVSVDYVADWSFLLQQGVPTLLPGVEDNGTIDNNLRQIALGAPFIEDQTDIGLYSLLMQPTTPGNVFVWRSAYGTLNPNPTTSNPDGRLFIPTQDDRREDDLRSGRVTFSFAPNTSETPSVPTADSVARVAYQTRDNWAQQLSVAPFSYKPYAPPQAANGTVGAPTEPWRDYYLASDNYLYFHPGEAGKSVTVSYRYNVPATTPVVVKTLAARPLAISEEIIPLPNTVPASFAPSGQVARLLLTDVNGNSVQPISIQNVRGTSVTLRTAYMNGSRYAQAPVTTNISRSLAQ